MNADEMARFIAELKLLLTRYTLAGPAAGDAGTPPRQLVTLDQAAAMIRRRKRTLYHHEGRPAPVVPGGRGRAALYEWADLRPWLERLSGMTLPARFPGY